MVGSISTNLPPAPIRFEELVDQLRHNGISLADPGTGRVIRLSTTGEQILSSREDIIGELANATEVSFNLYFAPSDNVFCSIRKLNDETLREGYSLDGKTEEESQHIIENLTRLFCKRAENGAAFGFGYELAVTGAAAVDLRVACPGCLAVLGVISAVTLITWRLRQRLRPP